jgi:hypothetical protein
LSDAVLGVMLKGYPPAVYPEEKNIARELLLMNYERKKRQQMETKRKKQNALFKK